MPLLAILAFATRFFAQHSLKDMVRDQHSGSRVKCTEPSCLAQESFEFWFSLAGGGTFTHAGLPECHYWDFETKVQVQTELGNLGGGGGGGGRSKW